MRIYQKIPILISFSFFISLLFFKQVKAEEYEFQMTLSAEGGSSHNSDSYAADVDCKKYSGVYIDDKKDGSLTVEFDDVKQSYKNPRIYYFDKSSGTVYVWIRLYCASAQSSSSGHDEHGEADVYLIRKACTTHTWKTTKAATCTATGVKTCTVCGETETIPKISHSYSLTKHV